MLVICLFQSFRKMSPISYVKGIRLYSFYHFLVTEKQYKISKKLKALLNIHIQETQGADTAFQRG